MNYPALRANGPRPENSPSALRDQSDRLQADYFLQVLTQNRRLVDNRIADYRAAVAAAEASGDAVGAHSFRRMTRGEEDDRRELDAMIAGLLRRFPRPRADVASPPARRVRLAAR
jgi:hypothetical protein